MTMFIYLIWSYVISHDPLSSTCCIFLYSPTFVWCCVRHTHIYPFRDDLAWLCHISLFLVTDLFDYFAKYFIWFVLYLSFHGLYVYIYILVKHILYFAFSHSKLNTLLSTLLKCNNLSHKLIKKLINNLLSKETMLNYEENKLITKKTSIIQVWSSHTS